MARFPDRATAAETIGPNGGAVGNRATTNVHSRGRLCHAGSQKGCVVSAAEERNPPKPRSAEETTDELRQRVQSLRLPREVAAGGSGSSKIAWTLCLLLAGSTGWLGYVVISAAESLGCVAGGQGRCARRQVRPRRPPRRRPRRASSPWSRRATSSPPTRFSSARRSAAWWSSCGSPSRSAVKKGDILAELEDTEYRADRDRAEGRAGIGQAEPRRIGARLPAGGNRPGPGRAGRSRGPTGAARSRLQAGRRVALEEGALAGSSTTRP